MKKFAAFILALTTMSVPVSAADTLVKVLVNGIPSSEQGVIVDSRTMVPVRGVTEMLGFKVDWDADTKTATFTRDKIVIKMTAGEQSFYVNDLPITPDVPQAIINDRFMLPLRAMCETVGAEVNWDGEKKVASIDVSRDSLPSIPGITTGGTDEKPDNGGEKKTDNNDKLESGIPGISIEIIDPSEVPDKFTEIELD